MKSYTTRRCLICTRTPRVSRHNVRAMCQSLPRRGRNMLRLPFLLVLLAHIPAHSYVTDSPSFAERLDKLYEKLENLTLTPVQRVSQPPENKLYAKLELLNSLTPDRVDISADDDELLSAMQQWGLVDPGQLEVMVKELEKVRDEKSEKMLDGEYGDGEWVDDGVSFEINTKYLVIFELCCYTTQNILAINDIHGHSLQLGLGNNVIIIFKNVSCCMYLRFIVPKSNEFTKLISQKLFKGEFNP